MEKNKLLDKLDKLSSFLEGAYEGISFLKGILNDDQDTSPQAPIIPNAQELGAYFDDIDDGDSREAIALRTYQIFADSVADYADFLTEQWDETCDSEGEIDREQFTKLSVKYIETVFYQFSYVFKQIKETNWRSPEINDVISKFNFVVMLVCDHDALNELFDIDFIDDLCELMEILIATVDSINIKHRETPFSDRMNRFYDSCSILNDRMADILNSEISMRAKKRAIRKYIKGIKKISSKLSDLYMKEAFFLRA